MMTTKIPFFREVILCSFECDTCGDTNNEVTFGGEIQEKGIKYELRIESSEDLSRTLIKADTATIGVPHLEFEIPARSQKGGITTVEGVLTKAVENLSMYQTDRMEDDPVAGAAVALVIGRLLGLTMGEGLPFVLVVDDPSGNSFVENRCAPKADPQLRVTRYLRSPLQDMAVGLQPSAEARRQLNAEGSDGMLDDRNNAHGAANANEFDGAAAMMGRYGKEAGGGGGGGGGAAEGGEADAESSGSGAVPPEGYVPWAGAGVPHEELATSLGRREILRMPIMCPHCGVEGESLTCFADIPHFKEVIIMAFDCAKCGFRTNEVKAGGGVPARGQTFTLTVESAEDLSRDVLKSATCDVAIPELDLEASQGSLGGIFTTVEGLLTKVHKTMLDSTPYMMGDSAQDTDRKSAFRAFSDKFGAIASGSLFPFTLVLRDPLASSFIGPRMSAAASMATGTAGEGEGGVTDPLLAVEDYARSWDEDEELGLHDIDTGEAKHTSAIDSAAGAVGEAAAGSGGAAKPAPNANRAMTHRRWGPDHPHEFAKGCEDGVRSTPGALGAGTGGGAAVQGGGSWATAESEAVGKPGAGPGDGAATGSTAAASVMGDFAKRWEWNKGVAGPAEEEDAGVDFEAAAAFDGARPGFGFRVGGKGLGYYRLAAPPPAEEPEAAGASE